MNRKFWENLVSLCGVHALNYIMPLLTLPFLARVLGPVHWGELAFAEAYAVYLSMFIEYGFGLSATREVARVRDNPAARSRLLAGVTGAQTLLIGCALALTFALGYGLPVFAAYRTLLPFAFILAAFRAIIPFWYFQGLERMRLVAAVTVTTNIAAAVGILLLVRLPQDSWIPLMLRAGAALISAAASYAIAYRDTPFSLPILADAWSSLRQGWSLFVFKGAVSLYTAANVVLLGVLATPNVVAMFAGAEKIANAAGSAVNPISQAFFPRISYLVSKGHEDATRTARLSLLMTVGSGLLLGLIMLVAAPLLVHTLLGPRFDHAVSVLRLLSVLPPVIAVSNVLGIQWMLPLRLDRQFNWIIVAAGVANIVLALILVPRYGQAGMAISVDAAELMVASAIFLLLRYRQLDPWSTKPLKEVIAV